MLSDEQGRMRFEAFAAAKTLQATKAILPPYVTESEAPGANGRAIGNAWTRALFDGEFYVSPPRDSSRPACSLVFVQSADGNTGAPDPATLGGGNTDKHLVYEGLSRVAADAVMAGAETVRGGDIILSVWHPELVALRSALGLPRHPTQIVATVRGVKIEDALLFNVPHVPVIILTVPGAANQMQQAASLRPWITVVVMQQPNELAYAFERLRAIGIATISCIGGRTLAAQLLGAHLVDDVYLTTSPQPGGMPGTPLPSGPWRERVIVCKRGTGAEAGVVFEHISAGS
jgi:5-amino-6-(5-phosphoribosylamino)uracil reductase